MNCKTVYRFICDNLDARIDSPRCRQIRQHLEGCEDCQSFLKSVKKTVELYKRAPSPRVPPAAHKQLMKSLQFEILRAGETGRKVSGKCR